MRVRLTNRVDKRSATYRGPYFLRMKTTAPAIQALLPVLNARVVVLRGVLLDNCCMQDRVIEDLTAALVEIRVALILKLLLNIRQPKSALRTTGRIGLKHAVVEVLK